MYVDSLRRCRQVLTSGLSRLKSCAWLSAALAVAGLVILCVVPSGSARSMIAAALVLVGLAGVSLVSLLLTGRLLRRVEAREDVADSIADELRHHQEQARQSMAQFQQSEAKYREVVENAASVILRVDASGTIIYCNDFGRTVLGYEEHEIVGKKLDDTIPVGTQPGEFDLAPGEPTHSIESELDDREGGKRWIAWTIKPIRTPAGEVGEVLCIGNDLTELRRAQADRRALELELLQSQKLESLGRLARGVAHDFNNVLMGIRGCSQILLSELDQDDPHHVLACEVEEYVSRAGDLTTQLLAFGRGGKFETRPINLNDVVEGTTILLARTRKEIHVDQSLAPALWTVEADPRQMEQVVLKLCLNAWQAMPHGGELSMTTENATLVERRCEDFTIPAGRYVHISVRDTGVGMDTETQRWIFEPFFSTRKMGRGVGLGLASVYGIVKNHGGYIVVESETGQGSTFHVYLPASDRATTVRNVPVAAGEATSATVLLVDDEPMILRAGKRLLEKLGYQVFTANGGEEALDLYRRHGDVGVVVLDMVMPGMSGAETFHQLKRLDPEVRVLLSSGYSADGQAQALLDDGCDAFIQKPYDMVELSETLSDVLARRAA